MAREIILKIGGSFEVTECDPDGSACSNCGDRIFLKAYKLLFKLRTGESNRVIGRVPCGTMCGSCGPIAKDLICGDDPQY